ncbi:MAG: hypothetical protein ABW215_19210 [Kibdelosporangium sp.]
MTTLASRTDEFRPAVSAGAPVRAKAGLERAANRIPPAGDRG